MNAAWNASHIGDLRGRTAIVTGANSGIGFETARMLATHGASVVLACRNLARASAAADRIGASGGDVRVAELDLADLASVRRFASSFANGTIDLLINNAGVMAVPYALTADGFEMQFGTDHLGHFALTGLLLPGLLRSEAPRVVTVSSIAHTYATIDFDDLQHERHYSKWRAYGQAKLANLLFSFELDRRAQAAGIPLVSVAAHPGYAATNIFTGGPHADGRTLVSVIGRAGNALFAQSAAAGALPTLYAATAPGVRGGEFFGPALTMWGHPVKAWSTPAARDQSAARRLWEVSEQLTRVTFDSLVLAR